MNNAIEKAKELGTIIRESQQMINLNRSEEDIEKDGKAKALLNEYKALQIEMVQAVKGESEQEAIDSLKEKLLAKQIDINEYETIKRHLQAKVAFDSLIKTINDVIMYSITGEEPCSPNKCGSCGGGCK